jgi:hypothetical protein
MPVKQEYIKTSACPECGCSKVVRFEQRNQHSNGQWNEVLVFRCGYAVKYTPNYEREDQEDDCANSGRADAWEKRRRHLAGVMIKALAKEVGDGVNLKPIENSLNIDLQNLRSVLEK